MVDDEGLTGRELLGQDGETLLTLLGSLNGDKVLDLWRAERGKVGRGGEKDGS